MIVFGGETEQRSVGLVIYACRSTVSKPMLCNVDYLVIRRHTNTVAPARAANDIDVLTAKKASRKPFKGHN